MVRSVLNVWGFFVCLHLWIFLLSFFVWFVCLGLVFLLGFGDLCGVCLFCFGFFPLLRCSGFLTFFSKGRYLRNVPVSHLCCIFSDTIKYLQN